MIDVRRVLLVGEVHGTKQSSKYVKKIIEAEGNKKVIICLEVLPQLKRDITKFIRTETFTNKTLKWYFDSGYMNPDSVALLRSEMQHSALIACVCQIKTDDAQYARNLLRTIKKYKNRTIILIAGRYHLRDDSKIYALLKSKNVHFERIFLLPTAGKFYNYGVRDISELDKFTVRAPAKIIKIGKTSASYYAQFI